MLSGQTSHPLKRFVLGGAQLGLRYGVTNSQMFDRRAAIAVVEAALDRGIECIDTAHAYGESEEVIGEVLQRRNVDPIRTVVTKIEAGRALRRSIRAVRPINTGNSVIATSVRSVRPAGNLLPDEWNTFAGMFADRELEPGDPILRVVLQPAEGGEA